MNASAVALEEHLLTLSEDRTELLLRLLLEEGTGETQPELSVIGARDPDAPLRASWGQERLWFIDRLEGGGAGYQVPIVIRLRGILREQALQRALDALVQRHEALRTVFVADANGLPEQQIKPSGHFLLKHVDLVGRSATERETESRRHAAEEAQAKIDLARGPLIAGRLLRLQAEEHLLIVIVHHIIADGWSRGIFVRELAQLYEVYSRGRENRIPPLPLQYADYVAWQRQWLSSAELSNQLAYWCTHLRGLSPQLNLPTDRPRPARQSYRGENVPVRLDARLVARLRAFAQEKRITLFMLLYAGWAILLSRLSGQEDVVMGVPIANRQRPEFEALIGLFANTVVMRVKARRDLTLEEFLEQVKDVTLAAYEHQDAPFEQVVKALQPERSLSRNPLFQVGFVLQNVPQSTLQLPEITGTLEDIRDEPAILDLTMVLEERGDEVGGILNYAMELYDRQTLERWLACYSILLAGLVEGSARRLAELPLLPDTERRRVLEAFNDTTVAYPAGMPVYELFESWAQRHPHAPCVVQQDEVATYAQINSRANRLARYLRRHGVGPDRLVAICVERSVTMVVAKLAVLKAGGAYIPLDPSYPTERLAYILENSAPAIVLTLQSTPSLPTDTVKVLAIDTLSAELDSEADENIERRQLELEPHHLAYVIYTSGSTGAPKGVMVTHRNLVNLIHWHCETFHLTQASRCLCAASLGFDAAAWEIWPALSCGATLVLPPIEPSRDAQSFLKWWSAEALDVCFLPTGLAEIAISHSMLNRHLKTLLVGGDRLRVRQGSLPFQLINNYGPTESTVVASSGRIRDEDAVLHIGRPVANTRIYILDGGRRPVPVGVAGELYIGGTSVARGYLNRPELTTERFLPDPFSDTAQARMYRTGDIGRWRDDGTIEFLGRNDHQVKVRGFRIELGEIEAQLLKHVQVKEVVVLAREDVPGNRMLVGYVTLREGADVVDSDLRDYVKAALPQYMVPSAFVILPHLPLTANGKLDRDALPVPEHDPNDSLPYEAPTGEAETTVAQIWRELLGVERPGRHDNFFDLGGHSLLAARVLARIRELLQVDLPLSALLGAPTLTDFSGLIDAERHQVTAQVMDEVDAMDAQTVRMRIAELERELASAQD